MLFLIKAIIVSGSFAKGYDPCALVKAGLQPIFSPCEQSVEACASSQNFVQLSKLFCLPLAQDKFDTFKKCTGESFSNQVFGTLCGGKACFGNTDTCIQNGQSCYLIHKRNTAKQVLKHCSCNSPSQGKCPGVECKKTLIKLAADIGCCVNGLMYTLPLDKCMPSSNATLLNRSGLRKLFSLCNIPFPSSCYHPFSSDDDTFQYTNLATKIFSPFQTFNMQCTEAQQIEFVKSMLKSQTCSLAFKNINNKVSDKAKVGAWDTLCTEDCVGTVARILANPLACQTADMAEQLLSWCQPADRKQISHCKLAMDKMDPVTSNNTNIESCISFVLTGACLHSCAVGLMNLAEEMSCCYHHMYKNLTILQSFKQKNLLSENGAIFATLLGNPALWKSCNASVPRSCIHSSVKMKVPLIYYDSSATTKLKPRIATITDSRSMQIYSTLTLPVLAGFIQL